MLVNATDAATARISSPNPSVDRRNRSVTRVGKCDDFSSKQVPTTSSPTAAPSITTAGAALAVAVSTKSTLVKATSVCGVRRNDE
jgi:uridylate kinase